MPPLKMFPLYNTLLYCTIMCWLDPGGGGAYVKGSTPEVAALTLRARPRRGRRSQPQVRGRGLRSSPNSSYPPKTYFIYNGK